MELQFTKMHGLGNDFIVLDFRDSRLTLTPEQIRFLADRRFGIGCDQVLMLEPARDTEADVFYRIYNADGGEAEQCGNGARCIAAYLREHGYPDRDMIIAETQKERLQLSFTADGLIRVNMGHPVFDPASIPLAVDPAATEYTVLTTRGEIHFIALSMGNPHAVLLVNDVETAPVSDLGSEIQQSALFPQGVNVGFMQKLDAHTIRLRVFERGVGETLACGSGACAAVVAGQIRHGLAASVNVKLKGGELNITREGDRHPVWMTGPATTVFKGTIRL